MDLRNASADDFADQIEPSILDSKGLLDAMSGLVVWKSVIVLMAGLTAILLAATIVCTTNESCRNHIPTVQNMLNSALTSPFVTTAINIFQLMHILLAMSIYCMCKERTYYWSVLQLVLATLFHTALLLTLFLVSFLGWNHNWANVGALVIWGLWMLLTLRCLHKYYKYRTNRVEIRLMRGQWVCLAVYTLMIIVYVIFRALSVHTLSFQGKDRVVLATEVLGGLAGAVFLGIIMYQTRFVKMYMQS